MRSRTLLLGAGFAIALVAPAAGSSPVPTCHGKKVTIGGTEGGDTIRGRKGPDVIEAGAGDDTIRGLGGNDTICAGEGDDRVNGGAGIDTVEGGPGDDMIRGGSGFDTLIGESGDDTLEPEKGDDVADGGPDSDTVSYAYERAGVVVDLGKHSTLESAGRDSLPSIENVTGSRFADKLLGDAGPNVLEGGPGKDRLVGRGGEDTLVQ
jgi:Ca2+-binding RTX toxin-like protein